MRDELDRDGGRRNSSATTPRSHAFFSLSDGVLLLASIIHMAVSHILNSILPCALICMWRHAYDRDPLELDETYDGRRVAREPCSWSLSRMPLRAHMHYCKI